MKILIGCEFSQIVTKAFRDRGHEAYSCDLLPTEGNPAWHIQDDILKHLNDGWDIMVAHPPCTYLTNAGVRHLYDHVVSRKGKHAAVYGAAVLQNSSEINTPLPLDPLFLHACAIQAAPITSMPVGTLRMHQKRLSFGFDNLYRR